MYKDYPDQNNDYQDNYIDINIFLSCHQNYDSWMDIISYNHWLDSFKPLPCSNGY